jgi:hypothetical protein
MSAPLLGVSGPWGVAEIELYRRFDELHQLIYMRGGIRPSNAALEEVAKLILVRLHAPTLFPSASPERVRQAFASALADPALMAGHPDGRAEPVWPLDEPFRLTDSSVLAAASGLVADIIHSGQPSVDDVLGTAFDALLAGRYDHAGGLGTYLTPSGVARMMAEIAVDLLDPSVCGDAFGDPYCGTGRFLVAMLAVLRERDHPLLSSPGAFGADQSPSAVAKARINMLLYGVPRPAVWTVRDSVTDSDVDRLMGTVSLILTNPPFGEGKYDDAAGIARTATLMPSLADRTRIDPALACLARCVDLLAPGGVLGIVLPDGLLASRAFASAVAAAPVAAMISLPTATFSLSGTVAKTSAVFLVKQHRPARVALARVTHVGYLRQAGRAASDPAGNELPLVPPLVRRILAGGPPNAAPLVVASSGGLDLARLDPAALAARANLIEGGGVTLSELLVERKAPHARTAAPPFVSVLHIDDAGVVDWPAASDYCPSTPGLLVDEGDLIVSLLNPSKVRAAVIPSVGGPVQVSAEFGVFTTLRDPYAVLGLLYSPQVQVQLRPLGTGTSSSRRRIDADDVLGLVVPRLDPAALASLGRRVREAHALIQRGRTQLLSSYDLGFEGSLPRPSGAKI